MNAGFSCKRIEMANKSALQNVLVPKVCVVRVGTDGAVTTPDGDFVC